MKGKTYLEVYGTETPKCGYQRGKENVAKRADIRQKISAGVKLSYINDANLREMRRQQCWWLSDEGVSYARKYLAKDNNLYRSKFEVDVANILFDNNINYEYEKVYRLHDDSIKIVDFVIGDTLVEVTGYAYKDWQENFNRSILKIRQTFNNKLIIICYKKHYNMINSVIQSNQLDNVILIDDKNIYSISKYL